jgi:catechol 2,3-dioxygenase-like lactoylglutathione lyase family enzyme
MTAFQSGDAIGSMYHMGIVVPDMTSAIDLYSGLLGFEFAKVREQRLDVLADGRPRQVELLFTYSVNGPPYLELIEEVAGSTWASDSFGMNHLGFWARDIRKGAAQLEAAGLPARVRTVATRVSYHATPNGVWVELVDQSFENDLAQWLLTREHARTGNPQSVH